RVSACSSYVRVGVGSCTRSKVTGSPSVPADSVGPSTRNCTISGRSCVSSYVTGPGVVSSPSPETPETPAEAEVSECTPNGIRTRAATLRGWCPRPLDDGGQGERAYPAPARAVTPGSLEEAEDLEQDVLDGL